MTQTMSDIKTITVDLVDSNHLIDLLNKAKEVGGDAYREFLKAMTDVVTGNCVFGAQLVLNDLRKKAPLPDETPTLDQRNEDDVALEHEDTAPVGMETRIPPETRLQQAVDLRKFLMDCWQEAKGGFTFTDGRDREFKSPRTLESAIIGNSKRKFQLTTAMVAEAERLYIKYGTELHVTYARYEADHKVAMNKAREDGKYLLQIINDTYPSTSSEQALFALDPVQAYRLLTSTARNYFRSERRQDELGGKWQQLEFGQRMLATVRMMEVLHQPMVEFAESFTKKHGTALIAANVSFEQTVADILRFKHPKDPTVVRHNEVEVANKVRQAEEDALIAQRRATMLAARKAVQG